MFGLYGIASLEGALGEASMYMHEEEEILMETTMSITDLKNPVIGNASFWHYILTLNIEPENCCCLLL